MISEKFSEDMEYIVGHEDASKLFDMLTKSCGDILNTSRMCSCKIKNREYGVLAESVDILKKEIGMILFAIQLVEFGMLSVDDMNEVFETMYRKASEMRAELESENKV